MEKAQFDIPVAFVVFNRPSTTKTVFQEIAKIKPKDLYIIADGARNADEEKRCMEVRDIVSQIDWECNVHKNYADVNLGCRERLNSGLSWVFENCEKAIILEDDCLPDLSFFPYCKELLEKYENDSRVMLISGDKISRKLTSGADSYYFSAFNHIWGWASWRRVWKVHDTGMKEWNGIDREQFLDKILLHKTVAIKYWKSILQNVYIGKINTWDYQLQFTCWKHNGLTIIPEVNLVTNIGILDEHATHPSNESHGFDTVRCSIPLPLRHPALVERNTESDAREIAIFYRTPFQTYVGRFLRYVGIDTKKIKRLIKW